MPNEQVPSQPNERTALIDFLQAPVAGAVRSPDRETVPAEQLTDDLKANVATVAEALADLWLEVVAQQAQRNATPRFLDGLLTAADFPQPMLPNHDLLWSVMFDNRMENSRSFTLAGYDLSDDEVTAIYLAAGAALEQGTLLPPCAATLLQAVGITVDMAPRPELAAKTPPASENDVEEDIPEVGYVAMRRHAEEFQALIKTHLAALFADQDQGEEQDDDELAENAGDLMTAWFSAAEVVAGRDRGPDGRRRISAAAFSGPMMLADAELLWKEFCEQVGSISGYYHPTEVLTPRQLLELFGRIGAALPEGHVIPDCVRGWLEANRIAVEL